MTADAAIARVYARHSEGAVIVASTPQDVFRFLDDHRNLSSHMGAGSSPMMGGGQMELVLDNDAGRKVGSHIVMRGGAFGFDLFLDEVVTERVPPVRKTWETVEDRLVVIGAYRLGFVLEPRGEGSLLTVWIDYDLPRRRAWIGRLGGGTYARWCVRQMLGAAVARFNRPPKPPVKAGSN